MKTILTALLAVLFIATQAQENNFKLECNFPELEADSVFLSTYGGEKGMITLASAPYNQGQFTLEGRIEHEDFYTLTLKKNGAGPHEAIKGKIYVEKANIQYKGEFGRYPLFTVNGGKYVEKVYGYQKDADYRKLRSEILSYEGRELSDEEKVALQKLQGKIYVISSKVDYNWWPDSHPKHWTSKAFNHLSAKEYDQFKEVAAICKEKFPNHPGSQTVMRYVEYIEQEAKNKDAGRVGTDYNNVALSDKDGQTIDLADVLKENKLVLLDFWASWCGPCRGEFPHLRLAYKEFKVKGFEIYAVSLDNKNSEWLKALKEEKTQWINVIDSNAWKSEYVKQYKIKGIPYNVLINSEGKIVGENLRGEKLEEQLKEVLNHETTM